MFKLTEIFLGKRKKGEAVPPVVLSIGHRVNRPEFHAWCKEFRVSSRSHQNASYYELKPIANVNQ